MALPRNMLRIPGQNLLETLFPLITHPIPLAKASVIKPACKIFQNRSPTQTGDDRLRNHAPSLQTILKLPQPLLMIRYRNRDRMIELRSVSELFQHLEICGFADGRVDEEVGFVMENLRETGFFILTERATRLLQISIPY